MELSTAVNSVVNQTRIAYLFATLADAVLCAIVGLVLALWIGGTFGTVVGSAIGMALFIGLMWLFANYLEPYFVQQQTTVTAVGTGSIPPQGVQLSPLTISGVPKV